MNETLKKYEAERKKIQNTRIICTVIGAVLIPFSIILTILANIPADIVGFSVGIVMIIVTNVRAVSFSKKLKNEIVPILVKDVLGENSYYSMDDGLPLSDCLAIGIYQRPDDYHLTDYIRSQYNGIPYEMCDCKLEERRVTRGSDGEIEETYFTYFLGRVIKIDIQRDFDFELKIIEKSLGVFPIMDYLIQTEVIEFNDKFNVYSTNNQKAFYVLTPSLIQKMLELEKMYKGTINFYMNGRFFYVYINNSKDSLEIKLNKPFDSKYLDTIRSEIQIAEAIINEFGLDRGKYKDNFKTAE